MSTPTLHGTRNNTLWILLVGLAQGLAIWALVYTVSNHPDLFKWRPDVLVVLFGLVIALPLTFYWLTSAPVSTVRKWSVMIVVAVVVVILGWHQAAPFGLSKEFNASPYKSSFQRIETYAIPGVLFVLVHLLCCHGRPYRDYFQLTWHNAVATALALKFTGLVWLVLMAASWLLETVRIVWLSIALEQLWFAAPITSLALSAGFLLSRDSLGMTDALRRYWLMLCSGLLLVSLAFALIWVLAWPFVDTTDRGGQSYVMLWFAIICVYCLNAAWQDGDDPVYERRWIRQIIRWSWLAVPFLAGVVLWSLGWRIAEFGWTSPRIWGVVLTVSLLIYGIGYALPGRHGQWMPWVARVNVFVAWVLCVSTLLLLSPIADSNRLAVEHQLSRLNNQVVKPEAFDFAALRKNRNPYGMQALTLLSKSTDPEISELSEIALKKSSRFKRKAASTKEVKLKIQAWPETAALPESFLEIFVKKKGNANFGRCSRPNTKCGAWFQDIDQDGTDEILLASTTNKRGKGVLITIYELVNGQYVRVGSGSNRFMRSITFDAMRSFVFENRVTTKKQRWPELIIKGNSVQMRTTK